MIQVDVSIMGQPYKLACKDGEEQALNSAVAYLNDKMSAIRDTGKVRGNDRIAVMAALSMAAELLAVKTAGGPFPDMSVAEVREKIAAMHGVLDAALAPQENLF